MFPLPTKCLHQESNLYLLAQLIQIQLALHVHVIILSYFVTLYFCVQYHGCQVDCSSSGVYLYKLKYQILYLCIQISQINSIIIYLFQYRCNIFFATYTIKHLLQIHYKFQYLIAIHCFLLLITSTLFSTFVQLALSEML